MTDTVRLWSIDLTTPEPPPRALSRLLDEHELARSARLSSPGERQRFVRCHAATRVIVGRYLGTPPESLRWRTGRFGKPSLADGVEISLAHSAGSALLALTRIRRVGVDLDRARPGFPTERFARRFFPPDEAALVSGDAAIDVFLRLWTRKEAVVKAAGGRLTRGLGLPVAGESPLTIDDQREELAGRWRVYDAPAPIGYTAALAVEGRRECRVIAEEWTGT